MKANAEGRSQIADVRALGASRNAEISCVQICPALVSPRTLRKFSAFFAVKGFWLLFSRPKSLTAEFAKKDRKGRGVAKLIEIEHYR
jgi:hypothetical protein